MLFSAIRAHSRKMTDYPTDNLGVFHLPLFFKKAILEPTTRCTVKVRSIAWVFKVSDFLVVVFFPKCVQITDTWPKSDSVKQAMLCVYRSCAATEAEFHALVTRCAMLPCEGLQDFCWRCWVVGVARCGGWGVDVAPRYLLTAHLSHFVSDCIHLGTSPVMFAGGCRASVFISCPKAM